MIPTPPGLLLDGALEPRYVETVGEVRHRSDRRKRMSDKSHFEKTVLLSFGHLGVVVASFLIPIFLSRWLSLEFYGTYKQLMLLYLLAMVIGHMGMDNALFFFVKNHPEREGIFSLNVMLFDSVVAGGIALLLTIFDGPVAAAFNNPAMVEFLPMFSLFLFFAIPTQHFEHYLTVLDNIKAAVALSFVYEGLKAAIIIGGFFYLDSMTLVFAGLAALTGLKYLLLLGYNLKLKTRSRTPSGVMFQFLSEQVRFSIPQGLTNLIAFGLKLDKFVISALFSVRQFTIYAVGCFEIPLIGSVSNTMTDLMSFEMVKARQDPARLKYLWHTTLRKVALFQIPVAAFLIFFASPVIRLVFSDTYRESARYFQVFTLILLCTGFSPEILFRVFARTRSLLHLQVIAALYTVASVGGVAYFLGPYWALVAKLCCDVGTLVLYSRHAVRLMGLTTRSYLPWKSISVVSVVSLVGALGTALVANIWTLPPFWTLAIGGCVYATYLLAVAIPTGLVMDDEVSYLVTKARAWLPFIPQR